jgi:dolichol-phosphate mannosyltransferase
MSSMSLQSANLSAQVSAPARFSDCLIFTPTYNERHNAGPLLDALLTLEPCCDVLVVDDSSTDGTTALLLERAAVEPRLRVVVRPGKLGIGSAHKLAWLYARRHHYSRIVTLDADFSHNPADIPRLLATLDGGAEVALGSRYMPGGGLDYRGWRLFLSRNANVLARRLLRLPITEYTTSLRAARLDRVPEGLVEAIENDSYGFFLSCAVGFVRAGLKVVEIPIHFRDRDHGASKIPRLEIIRGAVNLMQLVLQTSRPFFVRKLQPADDTCTGCGQPYRAVLATGAVRCLVCLDKGRAVRPS